MTYYISIDKCPHGQYAVALDDEKGTGTRLTPTKCCDRWERQKAWKLDAAQLRNISIEFDCAAEEEGEG